MNKAAAIASATAIASLVMLLSRSSRNPLGRKRPTVGRHRIVRVHTEDGRVLYRHYSQLSREEQRKINLGMETTYRKLLHTIAENPDADLTAVPTILEFSCGIDIHGGSGGTISFGCEHGFYWCVVTITGDEGISGECGYDPPTPATQS